MLEIRLIMVLKKLSDQIFCIVIYFFRVDPEKIDIFFHDSLHTYDHMMFEYLTSWDYLKEGGVLFSDDIVVMNGKGHSPLVDFADLQQKEIVVYNVLGGLQK